jgi:hypothetical protein
MLPAYRGYPTQSHLRTCGTWKPRQNLGLATTQHEYVIRKDDKCFGGSRMSQEAKAVSRKATGIHNRTDREIPRFEKIADVGQVICPRTM